MQGRFYQRKGEGGAKGKARGKVKVCVGENETTGLVWLTELRWFDQQASGMGIIGTAQLNTKNKRN